MMIQSNAGDRKAYYQIANACQNNQKVTVPRWSTTSHCQWFSARFEGTCLQPSIINLVYVSLKLWHSQWDYRQRCRWWKSRPWLAERSVTRSSPVHFPILSTTEICECSDAKAYACSTSIYYFDNNPCLFLLYFKSIRGIQENESHVDREWEYSSRELI